MFGRSNETGSERRRLDRRSACESDGDALSCTDGFSMSASGWSTIASGLQLSDRELQIIQGLFDGGSEAAVAKRLCLSGHTVHSHLRRVYRKLKVSNRTGLALRVFAEYLAHFDDDDVVSRAADDLSVLPSASARAPAQRVHNRAGCDVPASEQPSRLYRVVD